MSILGVESRTADDLEASGIVPEPLQRRVERWAREDYQRVPADHEKTVRKVSAGHHDGAQDEPAPLYRPGYRHGKPDHPASRRRKAWH
jgi:hypothetical protein